MRKNQNSDVLVSHVGEGRRRRVKRGENRLNMVYVVNLISTRLKNEKLKLENMKNLNENVKNEKFQI